MSHPPLACRLFVALALLLGAVGVAGAEALWPEFRGPSGQGHSTATGLPTEWGPQRNVLWRAPIPGQAWSSPIVAGGRVYLTNARPLDAADPARGTSLRVLALEAATGRVVWDTEALQATDAAALRKHDKNSHASPTPVYADGRIYAHFGHHGTACVDLTGQVAWRTTEHRYPPVHGTGGSPVAVDDLLVYNADGAVDPAVLALERATGRLRWRAARPPTPASRFSFSTPLVITVGGRKQIVTPGSGVVQALDPRDGREIWRVYTGTGFSVVPRPVYAHGLLFLSSGYQQPVGYAIRADGSGDVTATHVAWTHRKRVPLNPSMVVVGDEVYMLADSGILSCLDARTGEVHYEERVVGASSASLLAAEGRIYALDEQGKTAVVQAGRTFRLLGVNDLGERTLASMAVCDQDLLIRTEQAVYRIGKGPVQ